MFAINSQACSFQNFFSSFSLVISFFTSRLKDIQHNCMHA